MSRTSDLIRELTDLGLSQKEIERRTGIPQPRLSRWLAGGSATSDDGLLLAELLASMQKPKAKAKRAATQGEGA